MNKEWTPTPVSLLYTSLKVGHIAVYFKLWERKMLCFEVDVWLVWLHYCLSNTKKCFESLVLKQEVLNKNKKIGTFAYPLGLVKCVQ